MRYGIVVAVAALLLGVLTLSVRGQAVNASDKAFFDRQIGKLVKLEPHRITSAALGKVFAATFFNVDVIISDSSTKLIVARVGSDLLQVTLPSTNAEMPDLIKLVKPEFKLSSDQDGETFQAALDILYPIDATFNKDDLAVKAIKHADNSWTFVRGKFFEHFKGLVVSTNADGTITSIKYSLEIP